jgi:protein-glutamine gamma-glutamyltransferase
MRWRSGHEPALGRTDLGSHRSAQRAGFFVNATAATTTTTAPRWHWPGWSHLPRETRDVLFLLGVIAWTVAPHFAHLPSWCLALTVAVVLWRAAVAVTQAPLPGRATLFIVLALAVGLTVWSHRTVLGKDAGVTLLVVLMVLKTLELRARRDALVVFFLGFFIVLTNFLYTQSMLVAAAMVVSVWGLLSALVLAHMPVGRPPLARAGRVAAQAALLGAPIMVVLFMLFPRMSPLWAVPQEAQAKSGLSGSLLMGGVAQLANDDSIALRVRFAGAMPPPDRLYWRGPVLSRFDGREWFRAEAPYLRGVPLPKRLEVSGPALDYEMTLEPSRLPMLPLLEATPDTPDAAPRLTAAPQRTYLRRDLQWVTERPITERIRLSARAWLDHSHGPLEAELALREDVATPAGFNPRTLAWADELRRRPDLVNASPQTLAQAVLAHINSGFTYTLTPGEYGDEKGEHAVDEFWLDRRQGFCEHFSAAFVVIMRFLDVPARIVTGYQGADLELQDGWAIVRNSHAHAWAEIWVEGQGWLRVDPTSAVAPERIVRSRSLRPRPGLVAGAIDALNPALMAQLRRNWERINNTWNQTVLRYSRSEQLDLLQKLGWRSPGSFDLAYLLIGLISAAGLAGATWAWWDRRRRDPWQRLHERVAKRLDALDVDAPAHESPRRWAAHVRKRVGAGGEAVAAQLEALDAMRYSRDATPRPQPPWWRAFDAAVGAAARGGIATATRRR